MLRNGRFAVFSQHGAIRLIRTRSLLAFFSMHFVVGVGCNDPSQVSHSGVEPMSLTLTSTAFQQGAAISRRYTGDGADLSPPLHWSVPPADTRSLALICDDHDAPRGTWVHWVLFNLPPEMTQLDEGIPTSPRLPGGASQGRNDFGNMGYGGPAPPKGKPHRYFFKLYALSQTLKLEPGSTKSELETAMQGHVLATGQLMGTYQR